MMRAGNRPRQADISCRSSSRLSTSGESSPAWIRLVIATMASFMGDGLNAILVPLREENGVLGCINLVWVRQAIEIKDFVAEHLEDLQAAATEIVETYCTV